MQPRPGTLKIKAVEYPVEHSALVLIPPSEGNSSFALYLHADALSKGGGFLMLDHLPLSKISKLSDLNGSCISFCGDEPDERDTVGSESCDLETSGWTFPGYEDDDSKNWHFDTFHALIVSLDESRFRITVKCLLSNWGNDERLDAEADFETIGTLGQPPLFDSATGTWFEAEE